MRYTIAGEHLKFFHTNGYIEFEEMVPLEEISSLQTEIRSLGRDECFSRSLPLISKLIRRRQIDEITCSLCQKKKVRLIYETTKLVSLHEDQFGVLLLSNGNALFFKEPLYKDPEGWYLLLIFEEVQ